MYSLLVRWLHIIQKSLYPNEKYNAFRVAVAHSYLHAVSLITYKEFKHKMHTCISLKSAIGPLKSNLINLLFYGNQQIKDPSKQLVKLILNKKAKKKNHSTGQSGLSQAIILPSSGPRQ